MQETFKDLYKKHFLELYTTDDIFTMIIRGHLYIEASIVKLINMNLPKSEYLNVSRLDYQLKVNLGCAMGVIPSNLEPSLKQLGKLRNKYAHDLNYQLTEQDQNDITNTIKSNLGEPADYLFAFSKQFPDGVRRSILAIWMYLEMEKAVKENKEINIIADVIGFGTEQFGLSSEDMQKRMQDRIKIWKSMK
ncbi:hypothetical protein QFZ81_002985 [Paenibacillus sp. V4I9]|uniref:hypothetical protein n=1 Tax=Paenibacillus sp. V4I9 TaxID=3042308 RepID=UPI002789F60E|nr:hypothetical protein [Paenibacillus sp. V4I9]MDQ0887897.1 hypothetical protein [Paenibacillus sp. V4I9]